MDKTGAEDDVKGLAHVSRKKELDEYTTFTFMNSSKEGFKHTLVLVKCDTCIRSYPNHVTYVNLYRTSNDTTFDADAGTLTHVMTYAKTYGKCTKCERKFVTAKQLAELEKE
jgi:hypothetical protein